MADTTEPRRRTRRRAPRRTTYRGGVAGGPFRLLILIVVGWAVAGPAFAEPQAAASALPGILVVHPLDPERIYSLTPDGRLSRSVDGGHAWMPVPPPEQSPWTTLAVSPREPLTAYAVTADGSLWLTGDGGEHFELRNRLDLAAGARLTLDGEDPWRLYVDGPSGIERSDDGGYSWTTLWSGGFGRLAVDPLSASRLWIAVCRPAAGWTAGCGLVQVLESRDSGASWQAHSTCDPLQGYTPSQRAKLMASMEERPLAAPIHGLQFEGELFLSTWLGLYRPRSSGSRCGRLASSVSSTVTAQGDGSSRQRLFVVSNGRLHSILWDRLRSRDVPGDGEVSALAGTEFGLFVQRSDGSVLSYHGGDWQWLRRPLAVAAELHGAAPSSPTVVFAEAEGRPPQDPLRGRHLDNHVGAVLLHPAQPLRMYAGSLRGLFVSGDGGATWTERGEGMMPTDVHALAYDLTHDLLLAGTHGGGVYASNDDGMTWQRRSHGLRGGAVHSLRLDPELPGTVTAVVSGDLFVSQDLGLRWRRVSGRPPLAEVGLLRDALWLSSSQREGVAMFGAGRARWFGDAAAKPGGGVEAPCGADSAPMPPPNITGQALAVDEQRGVLYMGTDKGLWSLRLPFEGKNATPSERRRRVRCGPWVGTPGDLNIQALAVQPSKRRGRDGTLFAGTSRGLWRRSLPSRGGAPAWQAVELPDPASTIYSLAVDAAHDGMILAGGDHGGVFLSLDGGASWEVSRLPSPPPRHRVEAALQPPQEPLPEPTPVQDAAAGTSLIQGHLRFLPAGARRQALRWQTELWGRWQGDTSPPLDLRRAASRVRLDAAAELRRGGLRQVVLASEGRWLLASYFLDDGSESHDELRIFDLQSAPWRREDLHHLYGGVARWQGRQTLDREPEHLMPTWQWNDGGDLLAASLPARAVVTRRRDGELVLWDLRGAHGADSHQAGAHLNSVLRNSGRLTSDGVVRRPKAVRLLAKTAPRDSGRVAARFSADGRWLAVFDDAATVAGLRLWHLAGLDSRELRVVPFGEGLPEGARPTSVAWHPSVPQLAVTTLVGDLWLFMPDPQRGLARQLAPTHGRRLQQLTWSPDGGRLVALSPTANGSEGLHDVMGWSWTQLSGLGDWRRMASLRGRATLRFDASGRWLAGVVAGAPPRIWDLAEGTPRRVPGLGPEHRFLTFLGGGHMLLEGSEIEVWQLDTTARRVEALGSTETTSSVLGGRAVRRVQGKTPWLDVFLADETAAPSYPGRRVDLPSSSSAAALHLQGNTLVAAEGGAQAELWQFGPDSLRRARVSLGRYDRAHDDVQSAPEDILRLLELLPALDKTEDDPRRLGRHLCRLAGGAPSPEAWRQVLGYATRAPFCPDNEASAADP